MAKWKVPDKGYDYDDGDMVRGSLIIGINNYLKQLEEDRRKLENDRSEIDEFRDSFFQKKYKIPGFKS